MVKQRVLITGGAGYIGSVLTKTLLEEGYSVTCLDSLMYGQTTPFLFVDNPDYEFIRGDARNLSLISKLVPSHDIIFPLAAIVGMPACDLKPHDSQSTNLDAVRQLNEIRGSNQLVVFPNTNSGYGTRTGQVKCDETTPLEPVSRYGQEKVAVEQHLLSSSKPIVVFRLATVFGLSPRMRLDLLVNDFVRRAIEDGCLTLYEPDAQRNYVHIRDVSDAFVYALRHADQMNGQAFNLGLDSANLTKRELTLKIKEYFPKLHISEGPIGQDPDKRNYLVSNQKLKEAGFEAKRTLDQGIQELKKGLPILLANKPFTNL